MVTARYLGALEALQGRWTKAGEHLDEARGLAEALGNSTELARTLLDQTNLSILRDDNEQALSSANQCVEMFREQGQRYELFRSLLYLVGIKRRLGDVAGSVGHLDEASILATEFSPLDDAWFATEKAWLSLAAGQAEEAVQLMRKALRLQCSVAC